MRLRLSIIIVYLLQSALPLQFSHAQTQFPQADDILNQLQKINSDPLQCGLGPTSTASYTVTATATATATATPTLPLVDSKQAVIEGTKFPVSVVSLAKAKELFDEIKSRKDIPFQYPQDGCYARAHKMAMLLEEKGIVVAKAFLEGDLQINTDRSPKGYVRWWYHVAPVLLVEDHGKTVPYIIDPSTFAEPVPVEKWTGLQTCDNQAECKNAFYYTNRFSLYPKDKDDIKSAYSQQDTSDMETTLQICRDVLTAEDAKKRKISHAK